MIGFIRGFNAGWHRKERTELQRLLGYNDEQYEMMEQRFLKKAKELREQDEIKKKLNLYLVDKGEIND